MIPFSDPGSHMTDKKGVASVGGDWTERVTRLAREYLELLWKPFASKKWEGLVRFPQQEWRNKNLAIQIGNRLKR